MFSRLGFSGGELLHECWTILVNHYAKKPRLKVSDNGLLSCLVSTVFPPSDCSYQRGALTQTDAGVSMCTARATSVGVTVVL